uniref:4-hydroxyphenylpyruvate dioxygenase n=1 Tax=Anguilla anguilla TaxID=7936 RepID=A0A0E9SVE9_ANGAN
MMCGTMCGYLGRNQVDSFLENHKGAGIQHIGLYTQDIISTAHSLAQAGVDSSVLLLPTH